MLNLINTLINAAAKLPIFGKGKGAATVTGIVTAATGWITGNVAPHIITDQNIVPLVQAAAEFVTALGTLIAAFGFGRKVIANA